MWRHRPRSGAFVVGLVIITLACAAAAAAAQDPLTTPSANARVRPEARQAQGRAAAGQQADRLDIAELQRLFDAYTVMQAQEALQLDDAQFGQFVPKLKALQETRRRNDQARHQIVGELARLTAPGTTVDEAAVRDRLRALQDLDSRAAAELRRAYEAVDQQLDLRRQARFRVFEQNMERRKLQLMLRARRAAPGLP